MVIFNRIAAVFFGLSLLFPSLGLAVDGLTIESDRILPNQIIEF